MRFYGKITLVFFSTGTEFRSVQIEREIVRAIAVRSIRKITGIHQLYTKCYSIWFKIAKKAVTTIIFHSIWKEMETYFSECNMWRLVTLMICFVIVMTLQWLNFARKRAAGVSRHHGGPFGFKCPSKIPVILYRRVWGVLLINPLISSI